MVGGRSTQQLQARPAPAAADVGGPSGGKLQLRLRPPPPPPGRPHLQACQPTMLRRSRLGSTSTRSSASALRHVPAGWSMGSVAPPCRTCAASIELNPPPACLPACQHAPCLLRPFRPSFPAGPPVLCCRSRSCGRERRLTCEGGWLGLGRGPAMVRARLWCARWLHGAVALVPAVRLSALALRAAPPPSCRSCRGCPPSAAWPPYSPTCSSQPHPPAAGPSSSTSTPNSRPTPK